MERTVVIYKGEYGTTKQYAQWIAEELGCEAIDRDHFLARDFDKYDNIVFGGSLRAGGIRGFELIKKNHYKLVRKKIVVFVVGLNVDTQEARMQVREINYGEAESRMTTYFLPGAFDPKKLKFMDKNIIRLTLNMIKKTPESQRGEVETRLYHDMTEGADYVDRAKIAPIVAEFKS